MKVALDPVVIEDAIRDKKQISSSNYKKLVFTALQNDDTGTMPYGFTFL